MRILKLPFPSPTSCLSLLLFLAAASCHLINDDNTPSDKSNAPGLDSNTMAFIKNFQKQKLYTLSGNADPNNEAVIDPKTANITFKAGTGNAFGTDKLTFIRSLGPTKAVYQSAADKYWLLEYDSSGGANKNEMIIASMSSPTDNFDDNTPTSGNQGALYNS